MTISNLANFEMLLLTFLIQNIKEKAKGVTMASLQAKSSWRKDSYKMIGGDPKPRINK